MERVILASGRRPRQRTTLYGEAPAEQAQRSFGAKPLVPIRWRGGASQMYSWTGRLAPPHGPQWRRSRLDRCLSSAGAQESSSEGEGGSPWASSSSTTEGSFTQMTQIVDCTTPVHIFTIHTTCVALMRLLVTIVFCSHHNRSTRKTSLLSFC